MTIPVLFRLREDEAAPAIDRRAFLRLAASGAALAGVSVLAGGLGQAFCATPPGGDCPAGDAASYTASSPGAAGMFALFSDVHFDPFADPARVKALAAAPAGRWREILAESRAACSPYGQDSNDALFQSFLDDMARRAPRPDFLLYPGDLLCHRFWDLYPRLTGDGTQQGLLAFIAKTVEYFLAETARRFPGVPLYMALGNNDSVEGDYGIEPKSPFFPVTAPLIARLALKDGAGCASFLETYPGFGCYALALPGPAKGRLVVLNNIFWSKRYRRPDAGGPVLDYLKDQLERAGRRGEKVWLLSHIPPGDNSKASAARFLKKGEDVYEPLLAGVWNDALAGLLVKYAHVVRAAFAGHVHRDEFRLVYPASGETPAASMRLGPSISPITGNNPGYQVYTYDRDSLELLDMTAHFLDIGSSGPAWAVEYEYARTYGRGLRSPGDWGEMYRNLQVCPARRKAFAEGFDLRSAHIDEVTERTFPIYWESLSLRAGGIGERA